MNANRLHFIDGLRGIAALVVVFSHFLCAFYPATETFQTKDVRESLLEITLSKTPFNLLYNGDSAVCVFFVISGYVLSYSFFHSKNKEAIYSSAYRRYFRLMIPVLVTSVLYYLFLAQGWFVSKSTPIVSDSWWLQKMWNEEPNVVHFIKSTLYDLIFHLQIEPPYNPVLWSIGTELKGSYLVYSFLLMLGSNRFRWIGYALLMILTLKSYYFLFMAGMLMSDFSHQNKLYKPKWWLLLILLLVASYFGSYKYTTATSTWQLLDTIRTFVKPQAIGAIVLFYTCLHSRIAYTVLSTRLAKFLGEISYSLYLIHLLVIGSFSGVVFNILYTEMHLGYLLSTVGVFIATVTTVCLFAKWCTTWVDQKGVVFSKKIYGWLFT